MGSKKRSPTWSEYVHTVIGGDRQIDVAARTGVDQGTISRWLRDPPGRKMPLSSQAVRAFAKAYGRPVIEAFIYAGLISPEEAGVEMPRSLDLAQIPGHVLAEEVRRRLTGQ